MKFTPKETGWYWLEGTLEDEPDPMFPAFVGIINGKLRYNSKMYGGFDVGSPDNDIDKIDAQWLAKCLTPDEVKELQNERDEAIITLKKCSIILAGEDMSKSALISALESAQAVLAKAKERP